MGPTAGCGPLATTSRIRVAILGAGSSGLITAKTLRDDGFDVTVFTRDRHAGGVYARERLYPELTMNNVHGEFNFSCLPMPLPHASEKTGGRLTGKDVQAYMECFATQIIGNYIDYGKEVLRVRRGSDGTGWILDVQDLRLEEVQQVSFDKVVLCTGGCSNPNIPSDLSPAAARIAGFEGPVVHSSEFAREHEYIMSHLQANAAQNSQGKAIVVGGGKSAMDIATYFSKQDVDVTIVFEATDANIAVPVPLPSFLRRSRFLAILSPHVYLSTFLERFLHTTTVGSFIVRGFWKFLHWSSLQVLGVPSASPLVPTFHTFWSIRTNDLGKPAAEGFHEQARSGKITVVAPARAVGYSRHDKKTYVVLADGRRLEADAVVLGTGFKSSWEPILDSETRRELDLEPYDLGDSGENRAITECYTSLRDAPASHGPQSGILVHRGIAPIGNFDKRDFAVNGANFGTGNGMTHEVSAHWISAYFMRGSFLRIPSRARAFIEARREAVFVRRRFPETWASANESYSAGVVFWNWPQLVDTLLNDMNLKGLRSGGSWWNWIFKVVDVKEIAGLGEERREMRRARH